MRLPVCLRAAVLLCCAVATAQHYLGNMLSSCALLARPTCTIAESLLSADCHPHSLHAGGGHWNHSFFW